jgi:tRNA-specific 2-thiouridylase
MFKEKIAVAVSGGVDSLVAAYLLKQKGFEPVGLHFLTGFEKTSEPGQLQVLSLFDDIGIPVSVVDLTEMFAEKVVAYFSKAYNSGRTPNPCLVCNASIKFDLLLKRALRLGASKMATGHYARVDQLPDGRWRLRKGVDKAKDQSYFLSRLTQAQLERACFPLGAWTKERVTLLAAERGLEPITAKESQDICFIKDASYVDFLLRRGGISPRPGEIVTVSGRRIGTHSGLHRYTVGQRRGINCPASEPYYVVRMDVKGNRLVVGFKSDLFFAHCRVNEVNWISEMPEQPMRVHTRIRYRHRAAISTVTPVGANGADVLFDQPQMAVTPGQGAVFYQGENVLGSGWIEPTGLPSEVNDKVR